MSMPDLPLENIPAVDPEQFKFAVILASVAFSCRMPMESPATQGVTLQMEDGSTQTISFKDVPENRAMMVLRDHFSRDHEAFSAAAIRFFALLHVLKSPRMKPWTKPAEDDPRSIMIHDAVFRAGATVLLSADSNFNEAAFFAKVKEYAAAAEHQPDQEPEL